MGTMLRWDFESRAYATHEVPTKWNCLAYTGPDDIVNCPHCGKELRFGDTFISREILQNGIFGYGVCEDCYNDELIREHQAGQNERS